ncbi:hypothetical protein [Myxacorys almedinensis]|uniref:Uncharacterized protein n=1 Tax=Myxacorys almedinensis A TaxID=2690445 RepID=A0A8J7Z5B7_9CYAN|nr:hypothetical protein [Myxacorys almedinensis]NDJ16708.1 hypothetical protein [Myxacorys almedinensis A]
MDSEDRTEVSVCIGTFDRAGMPIAITKHLSEFATVAFQSITLNMLLSRCFNLELAEVTYIRNEDGSTIRIERNFKGFIGYLEASNKIN